MMQLLFMYFPSFCTKMSCWKLRFLFRGRPRIWENNLMVFWKLANILESWYYQTFSWASRNVCCQTSESKFCCHYYAMCHFVNLFPYPKFRTHRRGRTSHNRNDAVYDHCNSIQFILLLLYGFPIIESVWSLMFELWGIELSNLFKNPIKMNVK